MRTVFQFFSAGQIVFGSHSSRQTGTLARSLGLKRVFLLTDKILVDAGIVGPVADSLRAAGIEVLVFDEGEAEPSMATVARAIDAEEIEQAIRSGHREIVGAHGLVA